jgi:signal transduction histidine kinase
VKSVQRTLGAYGAIVALYALLVGWWVVFFTNGAAWLVRNMQAGGADLSPEQVDVLRAVSARAGRMFLFESAFLGQLMVGSAGLVLRALRRETELARQQRNFLSAVTHELRSPIASAKLYIESMQLGRADPAKTERYLRHAHEDLERLARIVDDLLEGRRLSERGVQIALEEADLAALVAGELERLRPVHASVGARLELDAPAPVPLRVDLSAVTRIVDNLVSNAVKYGGPEPRVELAVRAEGGTAVLEVRDHGPGLQGADAADLVGPFVRGGDVSVRTQQGVGLGLYFVRELVRAHGGRVSATDQVPGGGTRVRVELPVATAGGAPRPAPAAGSGAGSGAGRGAGRGA